ncbi:MAG TPA: alpha/beta hydrolase [Bryobacteraceae bacterium]|nr:alpha/beta hydrolase [Bryobacteraceae bacterium]
MATVRINDVDLYYESAGEGAPVLLLHGLGSSTRDWEYQIPPLAQSHRVIAMDVRGHGRSAKPPGPYSVKQFASDAVALLRALDATPAHVVGLSMGGMIAFQMAVDSPETVRSLTIINSGPAMILRTVSQKLLIQSRYAVVRIFGMRALARMVAGPLFPQPEQAELRKKFEDRVAENDPKAYLASLSAINGWSVAERIGNISCPVLIVASDHDYTPVAWKRAYAAQIPGARVAVLEDSRHAGPLDQPDQFNRVVLEFLGAAVPK